MKTRIMIVLALLAVSGTAYAEDAAAEFSRETWLRSALHE